MCKPVTRPAGFLGKADQSLPELERTVTESAHVLYKLL